MTSSPSEIIRPTIVVTQGTGTYFNTFVSKGDWLTGQGAVSRGFIVDGEYHLAIDQAGTIAWSHNQTAFSTGVYSSDVRLVSGPEASAYGLLLLADSAMQSFIYFMITDDSRYDIGICENSCQEMTSFLDGFLFDDTIEIGTTNTLLVSVEEASIIFSINGNPVRELRDYPVDIGVVGFVGESTPFYGFEAAFDNIHIIPSTGDSTP